MKKIIIIISAILCVVFGLYLTDYGYVRLKSAVEKVPRGEELFEMIEVVLNEFDFVKVINQVELSDDDYVDLILSGDDLSDLQNRLTKYIDEGFIRDEINEWRKAKIIVDGRPEKIKYKVHGTSVSPLHHGISLWARLRAKLGLGERSVAIGYGSFSLKIKHKKTSKYRGLMRRYNLITVNDDVELSTIAINKIAADIGLIAPYGKMVIVRINKSPIGMYMMVENHGKEWFERNHRLTNYTIMKSNDDWDRKLPGHVSDTDLYIQNKEVDGASVNDGIALSALDILFTAINSNDLKTVKRLIDVDYMAKYMAMLTITNNSHPITGDNLRYVYDHSIGRFKLLFRVEDTALKNINDISGFNASLFNTYPGDNIYTHKLFKLLVADPDFRYKRDRVLFGIIQNRDKMLEITANVFKENEKILFSNKKPTRSSFIKMKKFIRVLTENINKAERYLKYNKVYVTKYGSELKILNDSYNPTILVKIKYKGQKGRDRVVEKNQVVISPRLDMKQQIIHDIHRVNVQSGVINDVVFKNSITNKVIDSKHVYMNNASLFTVSSNKKLLNNLEESKINYAIDHANKSIVIKPGEYHLYTDIVMPYRYSVTLLAGVVFRLDEGVSFLIQGDFIAIGSEHKPIKIVGNSNSKHFGVFAIIGESDNFANVKKIIIYERRFLVGVHWSLY